MDFTEKERLTIDSAYKNDFADLSSDDVKLLIAFEVDKATRKLSLEYESRIQELESIITAQKNAKVVNEAVIGFYELAETKRAKWEAKRKAVKDGQAKQV